MSSRPDDYNPLRWGWGVLIIGGAMIIIPASADIVDVLTEEQGVQKLRACEYAARISHRSEEKQTSDSWRRFIQFVVMEKGDFSVIEHEKVTVDITCDRGITHEIVRHRIASYTQESTRFCNYGKQGGEIKVIKPPALTEDQTTFWHEAMIEAESKYLSLLALGCSPQIARSVLPNSLASRILCTLNLRSWRHVLMMRTTQEAHPQMREIMIPLLSEFKRLIPIIYDDIEPNQKQSLAMAKLK